MYACQLSCMALRPAAPANLPARTTHDRRGGLRLTITAGVGIPTQWGAGGYGYPSTPDVPAHTLTPLRCRGHGRLRPPCCRLGPAGSEGRAIRSLGKLDRPVAERIKAAAE